MKQPDVVFRRLGGVELAFDPVSRQYVKSTAQGGGYIRRDHLATLLQWDADKIISYHQTKLGTAMAEEANNLNVARDGLWKAVESLADASDETERVMKHKTGRFKDHLAQLTQAVTNLDKQMQRINTGELAQNLATLVDALERLDALERAGRLEGVLRAMRSA